MRWVDKYKTTSKITRKKRDYTSYKINNSHISFIKQQLKQNKTITMDELLVKLKTQYINGSHLIRIQLIFMLNMKKIKIQEKI